MNKEIAATRVKRPLFERIACRLNHHPRLDVIQSFGSGQHIGCPFCRREYGIHHGERVVIPWDSELDELYEMMGFDVQDANHRWRSYRA